MCRFAIHVASRSGGNISSDCPISYQLKICPPRPCSPNSGYSFGNTCGSDVQIQCVVCSRCIVSALPSSPDCTTKASSPAVKHSRNKGFRSQTLKREVIDLHGNTKHASGFRIRLPKHSPPNAKCRIQKLEAQVHPIAVDYFGHAQLRHLRNGTVGYHALLLFLRKAR